MNTEANPEVIKLLPKLLHGRKQYDGSERTTHTARSCNVGGLVPDGSCVMGT